MSFLRAWYFRWAMLLSGMCIFWAGMAQGDSPYLSWVGLTLILGAGALGTGMWACALALVIGVMRNIIWAIPVLRAVLQRSWPQSLLVQGGFALWESFPLVIGSLAGLYLIRKRSPLWSVLLVPAGLMVGLDTWTPRPYGVSFGAMFVDQLPGAVWLLGAEILGGLALGWSLLTWAVILQERRLNQVLLVVSVPLALLGAGEILRADYCARMLVRPKVEQDVIALQGAVAPFGSGYALMYERALYPMIVFSGLKPDLVILPENMVQVNHTLDKRDETSTLQRHFTAVGMAVAVPYSQVAFGVRDFTTSRIYWSQLNPEGKPDVSWTDMRRRSFGVDYTPSFVPGALRRMAWGETGIRTPNRVENMNLLARDAGVASGIKTIGKAIPLMSGEMRDPLLFLRIRSDDAVTVALNPSISGWMGAGESRTASVQAKARCLELGLVGYRVGQLSGTEFILPWRDTVDEVSNLGKGCLRFKAHLPTYRANTGFTAVFWVVSFFLLPLFSVAALIAIWMGNKGWIKHRIS